jgi:hypothetical protein
MSRPRLIQSTFSQLVSFNLNYLSNLDLGVPAKLFPSGFPTEIWYIFLIIHIHATCSAHSILLLLDHPNIWR